MVTPDDVNNPIFQKYSNDIRNPLIRSKIISKVKSLYDDHRAKINGLKNTDVKYPLDKLQDAGSPLDVHNFRDGVGNATDWVINNMPNISQSQFGKAVEIVDKNIKVQTLVSKAINNGEIIDNFESNEQMELFQTAILRRYGINDTNLTDVENPQLGTVVEIFKNQDMEPTAIIKKIQGNYNVNFITQGMVEKFEKNLALYNFIKSNDMSISTCKNENVYIKANNFGILGGNESRVKKLKLLIKL